MPTFSDTAIFDFVLLIGVLMLTINIHRREKIATATRVRIASHLGTAMDTLAAAIDQATMRAPARAQDWAAAAERIISQAMQQARELSETTRANIDDATKKLAAIQAEGQKFIADLAGTTRETIIATQAENKQFIERTRAENKQFIERTTFEATGVLQRAATANRELIKEQMTPLIDQLRDMVAKFGQHHETYRTGVEKFSRHVDHLGTAAVALKGSAETYTATAKSIDAHLQVIQDSQSKFIAQSAQSVSSMTESATVMQQVSEILQTRLRADLEEIARNVVDASAQLAEVDKNLARTSASMNSSSSAMNSSSSALDAATQELANFTARIGRVKRRRWWWFR